MRKLLHAVSFLCFIGISIGANALPPNKSTPYNSVTASVANATLNSPNPPDSQNNAENSILYSITKTDYIWKNGPASFPKGTQYVVLEGNPYSEGSYTIRVKFPPFFKLPAHFHTDVEQITVISGTIHMAVGDKLEKPDGFGLSEGGFTVLYPNINHYMWTEKEGAIVQIHGIGPRVSLYVDKKEDPTWRHLDVNTLVKAKSLQNNKMAALKHIIKKISFNEGRQYTKWYQRTVARANVVNSLISKKIAVSPVKNNIPKKQISRSVRLKSNTSVIIGHRFAEQELHIISPAKKYLLGNG